MSSWKDILQSLGFNSTRWQWRIMRWRQSWERRVHKTRSVKEHATYQHKICDECGALMDRSESSCPRCGTKAPSWTRQALQRFFGFVLPGWGIFSTFVILACFLDLQAGIISFGFNQLFAPSSLGLVRLGALVPSFFYSGEYWRLITYGYLHIGIMHIAFNLIALFQVGPFLEREIGSARFFSVYTLSLIGGGIADLILRSNSMFILGGASGALFGLIGFGISYNHFLGGPSAHARRNFFFHWAVYGLVFGFLVRADNIAHMGGLLVGGILGILVEREGMNRHRYNLLWNGVAALCLVLTLASFVGLIFEIRLPVIF
jgi:membrane associated rhomboid family serine protease